MNHQIEKTGTGSIEHGGTGSIERAGTGSIERTGTGSIEHGGTGSIENFGTGKIARGLALAIALGCVCSGAALAETASYATSHGTIDVFTEGNDVRISWHYDDGATRQFLVGVGHVKSDYGLIKLHRVEKIASEGGGEGNSLRIGVPEHSGWLKIASEGGGESSSVGGDWGGNMELIFTATGVEAVATIRNAHAERQSIVFDLNNSGEFARATVFLEREIL